jgi:RNA polymerase sigma-70 factor (ECF subfamily)
MPHSPAGGAVAPARPHSPEPGRPVLPTPLRCSTSSSRRSGPGRSSGVDADASELDRRRTDAAARRAAAGDRQALAYLYARHGRDIKAYANWIVRDEYEAEDITHHVFLKLMTVLPKYDPARSRFEAWMLRVTRNTAIDHLRHNRAVVGLPAGARSGAETPDPSKGESLRSVLAALNDSQREVLLMHQILGMSSSEMADRLDKSSGAVYTLYHRARLAAKRGLADLDATPTAKAQPAEAA